MQNGGKAANENVANAMALQTCEDLIGLERRSHLLANQWAFRADTEVETDEGGVRFQALLRCPAEALYDQTAIVGFSVGLLS